MDQGDLVTVAEEAARSGYTEQHLRRLVRVGKVRGKKYGRDWLLSARSVDEYRATDPRPGPKPRSRESQ